MRAWVRRRGRWIGCIHTTPAGTCCAELGDGRNRPVATQRGVLDGLAEHRVPSDFAWLLNYLFTTVLDGRNACLADGVQRALGREPRDFGEYVREAAGTGVWRGR